MACATGDTGNVPSSSNDWAASKASVSLGWAAAIETSLQTERPIFWISLSTSQIGNDGFLDFAMVSSQRV